MLHCDFESEAINGLDNPFRDSKALLAYALI